MSTLRTPIGRARGLGTAKRGAGHWWMQRLTAVALVPLLLWLVASLVAAATGDYGNAIAWAHSPVVGVLLLLTIGAVFYHAQLGMQVVIEDYVHSEALKIGAVVLLDVVLLGLGIAAALAVLRIAFGSP